MAILPKIGRSMKMFSRVCYSLILLSTCGVSALRSQEYELPDVVIPLPPAGHIQPDIEPFLIRGVRSGFGWRFLDSSTVEASCHCRSALPEFLIRRTRAETELYRQCLVLGTHSGVEHEWYLGSGVSAGVDGGVSVVRPHGLPFYVRMRLTWYPIEGLSLTLGFDPFWGLEPEWTFKH
jgi:hypothetical protein